MFKKNNKKLLLKFLLGASGTCSAFLVLSSPMLININNIGILSRAMIQNRNFTSEFNYSRVRARENSILAPTIPKFIALNWRSIIGSTNLYPTRFPNFIFSEIRNVDETVYQDPIYINYGNAWDYTWSNVDIYGEPDTSGRSFLKNYFNVTQYNSKYGGKMIDYTPNYLYNGAMCHNTCLGKTASYVMNMSNRMELLPSDPIVITMSKVIEWNSGGWNVTNGNGIEFVYKQSYDIIREKAWPSSYVDPLLPFVFFGGPDNNKPNAFNSLSEAYLSFIIARTEGRTGYKSLYYPQGSTSVQFHSLESSTMPNNGVRGNYLATEWAKDLLKSDKKILDYSASNAIPSTFYSLSGDVIADNLSGTIEFRVRPGILFDRIQIFSDESGFKYPNNVFKFVPRYPTETTFVYSGFKKVQPTELVTKIDVDNPYIQPQYVTVDEIKRIILSKGIIGSLPDGFTTNNIMFKDIKRYNNTGSIKATTYLSLYFDKNGDIQTENFSPIDIYIEGWAQTNYSVLPTSIIVKNHNDILPTDVSVDLIKEIIYNNIVENRLIWIPGVKNKNACFPQNFSKKDIIIKNGAVTPDNLTGTIRVDVMTDNFFNDNGEITSYPVNLGRVTLKKFKQVLATNLSNSAYDYTDPSNELYPTDVAANLTLLKNFIALQIPDFMKPNNFYPDRDVQLSNVIANNKDGTIYATVSLNNYYDSRGIVRQTGFTPKDIIFNFQNSISPTNLPIEINVSSTHSEIKAHQLSEEDIKQIIFDNILLGKPKDFTTNNIKFSTLPIWDSAKGRITVTPILNYWVDENGIFRTDPKQFQPIVIYGFSGSPITRFNQKILDTAGIPTWIPTSVAKHPELLKEVISKCISGKPKDFSVDNIEIISTNPNNIEGTLEVTLSLNYYNDAKGNPQTSGFEATTITIGGFATNEMPTSINGFIIGDSETLAQHFSQRDLKKILLENINFPVSGMNETNISFKNVNYDYINGRISFIPILNLWYGEDLLIHTDPKDFPITTIGGLKTVLPTQINKTSLNIGDPNIEASEFAEQYTKNLLTLVDNIIENKPESWNVNTSLELRNIVTNDIRGEIQMDVVLNNYYNNLGMLMSTGFSPETITITGFKRVTGATNINSEIELQGFEEVFPFQVTKTQIKQLIFENLNNKVPGMSINNIQLYNSLETNNFSGTIKVIPYVNAYYNDEGQIVLNSIQLNEVTFKNFKRSPGTTILSKNKWKGDPNVLPSDAIKDYNSLKSQVFNNLVNTPPNFNYKSDIEIKNLFYDNLAAIVSFDVVLKKVYDQKGAIVSGEIDFGNITIDGYFASSGYTSIPGRIQTTNSSVYASEMNEQELKKIIFNNVKNRPNELTLNEVFIKENSIVVDNRLGIIKLKPVLNWTYNIYGELINIPKEFDQIIIYGFKKSSQTTISTTTISASRFPEIANLYPNQLASNIDLLKQISLKLVDTNTTPTGFNTNNIEIESIDSNNYTGSINFDIKLNYYFDKNGVVQTTNFIPVTITIVDMQKAKGLTSILKIINSNNKTKTPENVTDSEIKQLIINNAYNLPEPFSENDIIFKVKPIRNNLNGSIKVIPILKKSYNINIELITTPIEFSEITINGFLTTTPTNLKQTQVNYDNTNILPSELSKDVDALKEVAINNLMYAPPSLNKDNVIIDDKNIIYDNVSGTLTFAFSLNKYYNDKGLLETTESNLWWITINKLLSISMTSPNSNSVVLPNVQTILPSSYADEKIINYIKTNLSSVLFEYVPSNFDINNDLEIAIREKSNINGSITATIKLKKYYNKSGQLIIANNINEYALFNVTFKGFSSVKPTSMAKEVTIFNQETTLAQTAAFDLSLLSNVISNNIDSIFTNLPPDFSLIDIVLNDNSIKSFDNIEGSITVEIGLKRYYDNNGNYIVSNGSSNLLTSIVKIKGFASNAGTTIIPKFHVPNYENVLPSSITSSDLSTIIKNNSKQIFSSLPSSNSLNGNLDVQILSFNNQTSEVLAKVSIYEYFDKNGDKISRSDNIPLVQNVIFTGFKSLAPTLISHEIFIKDQSNNLASNVQEEQLKILLYANLNNLIKNLPSDFSIDNNLKINILHAENTTGTIEVNVSLNYYINDFGVVVNANNESETLNKTVIVGGFKKVKQTKIVESARVPGYKQTNPFTITNEKLKNIVCNNLNMFFVNLPSNFNNTHVFVNIVSVDKTTGSIFANITLTTYYDYNESLIIDGSFSQIVKISGFRAISSPGSSTTTLIAIASVAAILSVAFVAGLLTSLKLGRKRIKL